MIDTNVIVSNVVDIIIIIIIDVYICAWNVMNC